MTHPTYKRATSPLTGANFRELRHRIKEISNDHYSAEDFARELKISPSLLQLIETDDREITPPRAAAFRSVERSFIFCLKESEQVSAQAAAWLVEALIRHHASLSPRDRKRLEKLLEQAK